MAEKIKITQEQAEALRLYRRNGHRMEEFVVHGARGFNDAYEPLKGLPVDVMARLLYEPGSFEVEEEEYKIGDPVKYKNFEGKWIYGTIERFCGNSAICRPWSDGGTGGMPVPELKRQTPEEIKAEQERRVWAKIGRKPGEVKFGDKYSVIGCHYTIEDAFDMHVFKDNYESGIVRKFYPVESAVEFGGGEE